MNPLQLSNTLYGMVHGAQSVDSIQHTINNNFANASKTEQDIIVCLRELYHNMTIMSKSLAPMLELAEHVMKNHPQIASDFATTKGAAVKILGGNNGGG